MIFVPGWSLQDELDVQDVQSAQARQQTGQTGFHSMMIFNLHTAASRFADAGSVSAVLPWGMQA